MSELWIRLPPPRCEPGATLVIALAIAVVLHALPLLALEPAREVTLAPPEEPFACCLGCERRAPRDEAIERALDQIDEGRDTSWDRLAFGLVPDADGFLLESHWFRDAWRVRALVEKPRPWPTLDGLQVVGALDRWTVRRLVRRSQTALATCQARSSPLDLERPTGERGLRATWLAIEPDGHADRSEIVIDDPLGRCVATQLSAIRFPRSTGVTQVYVELRYGTTDRSAGVFVR